MKPMLGKAQDMAFAPGGPPLLRDWCAPLAGVRGGTHQAIRAMRGGWGSIQQAPGSDHGRGDEESNEAHRARGVHRKAVGMKQVFVGAGIIGWRYVTRGKVAP